MLIQTLVLSLLQSITEFLPVSSSGHLILLPFLLGWKDQGISLDIGMHLGTLLAVCVYFWRDLGGMFIGLFKGGAPRRLVGLLVVATIPILTVGFFAGSVITRAMRNPISVCIMLIVFGIVLWLADKYSVSDKKMENMSLKDALIIGGAQCLSLVPGTSRSGITMTAARFCGVNRSDATRFSMLLSIPAIGAAGAWLLIRLMMKQQLYKLDTTFFEGILFAFLGGLAVIWFLMSWVRHHSFFAFMVYRVIAGVLILFFLFI